MAEPDERPVLEREPELEPDGEAAQAGYDVVVVGSGYGGSVAACRLALAKAGFRICILEKGRRWDFQRSPFPTTFWGLLRNLRVQTPLGSWGKSSALYQLYFQRRACTLVGAGLGGGSLVNAGLLLATPKHTRGHRDWPKEWEQEWERSQGRAMAMLQPEPVPSAFPMSQVMDAIARDIDMEDLVVRDRLQGSFRFQSGSGANAAGVTLDPCLACGNCVTGCNYNAKNSLDKNYLALAIQEGAHVRTECEVLYVLPNMSARTDEHRSPRRWRVYVNEVDYIEADFVVLAAGTFGSTQILLRSRERGLALSSRLGMGVSCNGSHVGIVVGTKANTMASALTREKFFNIPLARRTGPSISASYSSRILQFVLQGGAIPTAYPHVLLKGVFSHRVFPPGPGRGFSYGLWSWVKGMAGVGDGQAILLNVMGADDANGRIDVQESGDKGPGRLRFFPPHDAMLSSKIKACQRLAMRLGGVLFMSCFHSTSVHPLGGCNVGETSSRGVANTRGQVFVQFCEREEGQGTATHPGLYVCDGSLIPCSVGVNPTGTITTAAEIVASHLVDDAVRYLACVVKPQRMQASELGGVSREGKEKSRFLAADDIHHTASVAGTAVVVKETLKGNLDGLPCTLHLVMHMSHDCLLRGLVGGYLRLKYVDSTLLHIVDGCVDMCFVDERTPYTQYMHYHLLLTSSTGARFRLEGKKVMHPFLLAACAWQEATTLHMTLQQLTSPHRSHATDAFKSSATTDSEKKLERANMVHLEGQLHVSVLALLRSLVTLRGRARFCFVRTLVSSLVHTYFVRTARLPTSIPAVTSTQPAMLPNPACKHHNITTADGQTISMLQWPVDEPGCKTVVLLLNGYSIPSFHLPTEPHDLVRTLYQAQYEPWQLNFRLDPAHPSNSFTLDDLAQYDISAAFARIREVKGRECAVHVVAFCAGGLAIHMALLGGYVPASEVASLVSINSAMFFTVTTSARIKLLLPLIPLAMAILGNNRVLSLSDDGSRRHSLLRAIARLIPRSEQCSSAQCNVFSGIFGTGMRHGKVSRRMHEWLYQVAVPRLPMAGFPQLRHICLQQRVVDAHGRDVYMAHPERMAVRTTYLSGENPVLVTPETSRLAHRLMVQHHPNFRHRRVLLRGYGHADLLLGEDAYQDVFPHILSHIAGQAQDSQSDPMPSPAWDADTGSVRAITYFWLLAILAPLLAYIYRLYG